MSAPRHILVVEDDPALREAVRFTLDSAQFVTVAVASGTEALDALARQPFDLVLTDLRMQPLDGLALLRALRSRTPHLPVMLMTAFGDVEQAVTAMRAGACDFILKPFAPEHLIARIRHHARPQPGADPDVAVDPASRRVFALAARVAATEATVLLLGESGVGKEVLARYIHKRSPRAAGPFVAINCAAIPDNLLEATLFGYERGAFTGAQTAHPGKFEQAQQGTLLLDEISELPLSLQAKLLRVVQEREVERVGGKKTVALNIRVLATSNRDLPAEVAAGRFRADLYHRLNVFPLTIPPLRERPADILPLARAILQRHAASLGGVACLAPDSEPLLCDCPWQGNVRELENVLSRALILANGAVISAEVLRLSLPPGDAAPPAAPPVPAGAEAAAPPAASAAAPRPAPAVPPPPPPGAPTSMAEMEREHILATLRQTGGSRQKTIAALGISERTLRNRLKAYRTAGYPV